MRQNPRKPPKLPPRRRRDADLPAVPTFQPDPEAAATPPSEIEDDQVAEAIRRMVEAAYT
jgi:hypothetical protein